jgi:hypothetical protein
MTILKSIRKYRNSPTVHNGELTCPNGSFRKFAEGYVRTERLSRGFRLKSSMTETRFGSFIRTEKRFTRLLRARHNDSKWKPFRSPQLISHPRVRIFVRIVLVGPLG